MAHARIILSKFVKAKKKYGSGLAKSKKMGFIGAAACLQRYETKESKKKQTHWLTSADATRVRKSPTSIPEKTLAAVTAAFPCVRVPVLSNITCWILSALSKASPPFIRTPWLAPTPVATITAVGVARPRAQGQAITTTDIENMREKTKQLLLSVTHESGYAPSDPQRNLHSVNERVSIETRHDFRYMIKDTKLTIPRMLSRTW